MDTFIAQNQHRNNIQKLAELVTSGRPSGIERDRLINEVLKDWPIDNSKKLRAFSVKFWQFANAIKSPRLREKIGKKLGKASGKIRTEKAGKNQALKAWKEWQNEPDKKPYGNKRGCIKAFDLDMCNRYKMELETISKWRQKWQRDLII